MSLNLHSLKTWKNTNMQYWCIHILRFTILNYKQLLFVYSSALLQWYGMVGGMREEKISVNLPIKSLQINLLNWGIAIENHTPNLLFG